MATKKKQESSSVLPLAVGAIAGIAGMYFLHGRGKAPKGNRQKIKSWMLKAKGEALEKVEKMKVADEEAYLKIIDGVMEKYNKLNPEDKAEIEALGTAMKRHWKNIQRDLAPKKKVKKIVKKIGKTIAEVAAEEASPKV